MQPPVEPASVQVASPPVTSPPSEGSSLKWWIVAGVFFVLFLGIIVWYFSTQS